MKPQLKSPPRAAVLTLLGVSALCLQALFAQNTPAQSGELLSVSVIKIRPEMVAEYEDAIKNEGLPALKKGGLEWRHTWTRAAFGEAFQYSMVSPIAKYAQYDGQGPLTKALGEAGARAHLAKLSKYIESIHTYAIRSIPHLSWEKPMDGPPNLAVLTTVTVAPGRRQEYLEFLTKELVPTIKKSDLLAYSVYETVFGGNPNEFVSVAVQRNYAELDKGSPLQRVLGEEGAARFMQKLPVGVVTNVQRSVIRLRPELSILRTPAKTTRATE